MSIQEAREEVLNATMRAQWQLQGCPPESRIRASFDEERARLLSAHNAIVRAENWQDAFNAPTS